MQKRALQIVLVLALIGLGVSTYSLLHHAEVVSGSFCDINTTFNCDVVNRGVFSEIAGIPVALLGVIGYALIALAAALRLKDMGDKTLRLFLLALVVGGFGFTLYLTGIEAFVLRTFCLVCLFSQLVMLAIFSTTLVASKKSV